MSHFHAANATCIGHEIFMQNNFNVLKLRVKVTRRLCTCARCDYNIWMWQCVREQTFSWQQEFEQACGYNKHHNKSTIWNRHDQFVQRNCIWYKIKQRVKKQFYYNTKKEMTWNYPNVEKQLRVDVEVWCERKRKRNKQNLPLRTWISNVRIVYFGIF